MESILMEGGDCAQRAQQVFESLQSAMPQNATQLKAYLEVFLNYSVPSRRICDCHVSPLEYLWHAFSCDMAQFKGDKQYVNGDCIVWANRGGGKTQLAAIATLLEGVFKPKCQTRILAGSLDQSSRMYEYLCEFVSDGFEDHLQGRLLKGACDFVNGAGVQVLPQSARAVRGRHIHKLRCDEIEMFDEDVFNAAKFVTQSTDGYVGAMEMLSTMHRPYGLMQKLIDESNERDIPVFKWCMWEVVEKCRTDRSCSRCPLWTDCGGKARNADGYLKIDDCISQMRRSSRAGFEAEMLCLRPNMENAVFDRFDPSKDVKPISYDSTLPIYRAIDFGFVNPFVCLWLQVDNDGVIRVFDEYVKSRATISEHAQVLKQRTPVQASQAVTFCDPAGAGRNDVTGTSSVRELAALGIRCRYRRSGILEGIEKIRAALCSGDGKSNLVIDSKCTQLIRSMQCYHYPDTSSHPTEQPEKDGIYDHPIDALRYFFINYLGSSKACFRKY